MDRYFRLSTDCFLVEGANDAVLYDVTGKRVLLLDETLRRCLQRCERNEALDDAWCDERCVGLLDALSREGLGAYDGAPAYVDKFRVSAPVRFVGTMFDPARFYRLTWSITNDCDRDCGFCPRQPGDLVSKGCMLCVRRGLEREVPLADAEIGTRVDQIAALGIRMLHIRGGNPLLRIDTLRTIVRAALKHPALTVIVTTPGTGCPIADVVALAASRNVRFNIVLVPPGQRDETRRLVAALQEAGIAVSFTRLDDGRVCDAPATAAFAGIRTAADLAAGADLREHADGKRVMAWSSPVEFYNRVGYSVCGVGHCEIACDGTIHPCAAIDDACGAATGDLTAALAGPALYERWWRMSKDEIEPCRRCALRYACVDCTAVAVGRPDGVRRCCAFDPTGAVRATDARWIHPDLVVKAQALLAPAR